MKILQTLCVPQIIEVEMFGWTGTYQLDGLALPWCRFVRTDYTAGCRTPKLMYLRLGEDNPTAERPSVRFSTVDPEGLPGIEGEAPPLIERIEYQNADGMVTTVSEREIAPDSGPDPELGI